MSKVPLDTLHPKSITIVQKLVQESEFLAVQEGCEAQNIKTAKS